MLDLLDGHSFVYSHCSKGTTELVRMNFWYVQLSSKSSETYFDSTYLEPFIWSQQRHKQSFVSVGSAVHILLKVYLGTGIEVNLSLLIAFTRNNTLSVLIVYIISI